MINIKSKTLPAVLFITFLMGSFGSVANADALHDKLKMCKQEFAIAHKKDSTQGMAAAAKLKHLTLMKEILHELNNKNANKDLSAEAMQENVMVMSHLLEMLVIENLAQKNESWNMNY